MKDGFIKSFILFFISYFLFIGVGFGVPQSVYFSDIPLHELVNAEYKKNKLITKKEIAANLKKSLPLF